MDLVTLPLGFCTKVYAEDGHLVIEQLRLEGVPDQFVLLNRQQAKAVMDAIYNALQDDALWEVPE